MRFAFCLFKYFPYGGLGRDFISIAKATVARGHEVHVYTMDWPAEMPPEFRITVVPVNGYTNRARCASFVRMVSTYLSETSYDAVVGFNRMPGLDIYYAADVCHAADVRAQRFPWLRFTPRHQLYSAFEQAVFGRESSTEILLISEREKQDFQRYYGTPEERFHLLPPGVSRDRLRPDDALEIRGALRRELGIPEWDRMLLMVGSNWKKKGLDRALHALASLPTDLRGRSHLTVLGKDRPRAWEGMARRLGVERQVRFLGLRNDVPRFLLTADLLLHPAYRENTGTVLLEALVAGLPVLASEACGYSFHIDDAEAGLLIPAPFRQDEFDRRLKYMLTSGELERWSRSALEYARTSDLFSLSERAVEYIEEISSREPRPQGVTT